MSMMQVRFRRQAEACRSGKKGFLLTLILFTAVLSLFLGLVNARIKPVVETVGTARAKAVANASIMRAVEEELKDHAEEYRDLTMLRMGQNGEISAVQSNIVKINQLKTRISERVQENLTLDLISISIPLGNLIGGELFSGRGPSVRFKLLPFGTVSVDVDNEFTTAGINQTLHRIVLDVMAGISIILPVSSVTATAHSRVIVAETIIVGSVPERFASYGAETSHPATETEWMMEEN